MVIVGSMTICGHKIILFTACIIVKRMSYLILFFVVCRNFFVFNEITDKQISIGGIQWIGIYSGGLIIFTIVVSIVLAFIRDKGRLYKIMKFFKFTASPFDNLWDEIVFIYSLEKQHP